MNDISARVILLECAELTPAAPKTVDGLETSQLIHKKSFNPTVEFFPFWGGFLLSLLTFIHSKFCVCLKKKVSLGNAEIYLNFILIYYQIKNLCYLFFFSISLLTLLSRLIYHAYLLSYFISIAYESTRSREQNKNLSNVILH